MITINSRHIGGTAGGGSTEAPFAKLVLNIERPSIRASNVRRQKKPVEQPVEQQSVRLVTIC